jgi:hypothetical protein
VSAQNQIATLGALLGLAVVWLVLLGALWLRLIRRHPDSYVAMGRPRFLTPLGAIATLRFVIARHHRALGDRMLGVLSDFALVVLVIYVLGFAALCLTVS